MADMSPATRYSDYELLIAKFDEKHDESFLREAFRLLDLDSDGYVSKEELLAYYTFRDSDSGAEFISAALFRLGDTNRDGFLDEGEFIKVASQSIGMRIRDDILTSQEDSPSDKEFQRLLNAFVETRRPQYLEGIFRLIDSNHDGVISKAELRESFFLRGTPNNELAAEMMMLMGDTNLDGVLSLEEFKALMSQNR